jgi:hypothetical protein
MVAGERTTSAKDRSKRGFHQQQLNTGGDLGGGGGERAVTETSRGGAKTREPGTEPDCVGVVGLLSQRHRIRRLRLNQENERSEYPACNSIDSDPANSAPDAACGANVRSGAIASGEDLGDLKNCPKTGGGVMRLGGMGPRHDPARGGFDSRRPPANCADGWILVHAGDAAPWPSTPWSPSARDGSTEATPDRAAAEPWRSQNLDAGVGYPTSFQNSCTSSASDLLDRRTADDHRSSGIGSCRT